MDSRGGVAQLVRANGSYPLGQQFKSACRYHLFFLFQFTTLEQYLVLRQGNHRVVKPKSATGPHPQTVQCP